MLHNGPPVSSSSASLLPPADRPDCVEVGEVRVIGGVRPQNFDVAYRPDGLRIAFDSKTLNDRKSIGKNWQNMVNDLGTEAATVHSRFPYGIVCFLVALPAPCVSSSQQASIVTTLLRLARRERESDSPFLAEAVTLVLWDPATGAIDAGVPDPRTAPELRIEHFSAHIERAYISRYG